MKLYHCVLALFVAISGIEKTHAQDMALPAAGEPEVYSPSENTKSFRPVAAKYLKTWSRNPVWFETKARIVPYLDGFDNYQMSLEEYTASTNIYGSSTTLPRQQETGRFYVKKVDGRFWLVDPYGYLQHHRGVASLRPSKDENGADDSTFVQKYGDRSNWISEIREELACIGFHNIGAFSTVHKSIFEHNESHPDKPLTLCPSFYFLREFKNKHTDLTYCDGDKNTAICLVLDDRWEGFCEEFISEGKVREFLDNRNVVGIFSDNEIDFSSMNVRLLDRVLKTGREGHPAYEAAQKFMEERDAEQVTDALNDEWAGMLAEKYYKCIKEALKKHDPQMLYLGSRLHGTPKIMEHVFRAAGRWCDVISINYYGSWSVEAFEHVRKWAEWAPDTPFMITEFYTKGNDCDLPNITGAGLLVPTQKDRALAYQHFTLGLLEAKNCVGWHWFKYQDDAAAEYGEKASNKGLYDKNYNIYPWMEEYTRMLNFNTYRLIEYFDK